ncbi:MAG: YjfB family protein [Schwartzia sp. (in: firmicutes)]
MDLTMNIAALSVGLSEAKTQQGLQISMMKKAMDMAGEGVEELLAATGPVSLDPSLGTTVDMQA